MMCQEVIELMQRYLDRDLDELEYQSMLGHIQQCPDCTDLFERLMKISNELEHLPKVTPPFSLVDAIMPAIERYEAGGGAFAEHHEASADMDSAAAAEHPAGERSDRSGASWRKQAREWMSLPVMGGVVAAGLIFGFFAFQQPPAATDRSADSLAFEADQRAAQKPAAGVGMAANEGGASTELRLDGQMTNQSSAGDEAGGAAQQLETATGEAKSVSPKLSDPLHAPTEQAEGEGGNQATGGGRAGAGNAADQARKLGMDAPPAAKLQESAPRGSGAIESFSSAGDGANQSSAARTGSSNQADAARSGTESAGEAASPSEKRASAPESSLQQPEEPLQGMRSSGSSYGLMAVPSEPDLVHELPSTDGAYIGYVLSAQVVITDKNGAEVYRSRFEAWKEADQIELLGWSGTKLKYSVLMSGQTRTFEIDLATKKELEIKG
ncbi:zf-HC2 domain-containing protein [Paenibacillus sp. YYML68]|uniref:zf-HC2 domain-containing protein n=1 Tax=Paenibacillus sp. YYML68 TaxID=2909250 RepID=UPI0028526E89|nr:zf-HC2 domain-containing protein [Paenibacillus sp. YYML68]